MRRGDGLCAAGHCAQGDYGRSRLQSGGAGEDGQELAPPRAEGVDWPDDIPYPVFAICVHLFLEYCPLEAGPTAALFTNPREKLTEDYVTGRFG